MKKVAEQAAKYGCVAGVSALSDWLVFVSLTLLGVNYLVAQGSARLVGGLVSFSANKYWSFEAGKVHLTSAARRFLLLYCFSYALSLSLLYWWVDLIGLSPFTGKLLADTSCLFVNFVVMRSYVFTSRAGITKKLSDWLIKATSGRIIGFSGKQATENECSSFSNAKARLPGPDSLPVATKSYNSHQIGD